MYGCGIINETRLDRFRSKTVKDLKFAQGCSMVWRVGLGPVGDAGICLGQPFQEYFMVPMRLTSDICMLMSVDDCHTMNKQRVCDIRLSKELSIGEPDLYEDVPTSCHKEYLGGCCSMFCSGHVCTRF